MENQIIEKPKMSKGLLEVSLEDLHIQSLEWMEDIRFMRDELAIWAGFLEKHKVKAIDTDELHLTFLALRKELVDMENISLTEHFASITFHEGQLKRMLETERMDEKSFREIHQGLFVKFRKLTADMKKLKEKLFAYFRKLM